MKEKDPQTEILFVGTAERMESTEIPKAGYAFEAIKAKGLNGSALAKVQAVMQLAQAYFACPEDCAAVPPGLRDRLWQLYQRAGDSGRALRACADDASRTKFLCWQSEPLSGEICRSDRRLLS